MKSRDKLLETKTCQVCC